MKGWLCGLLFSGIGFGVGFFAGERFGRKKKEKESAGQDIQPGPAPEGVTVESIAIREGYIPDEKLDQDIQEVETYLAGFESPSEEDAEEEPKPPSSGTEQYIHLISADEWDAETEFSHVCLTYYDEDEIVCDEDEAHLDDAEDLIGEGTLLAFGSRPDCPPDVVYVRNDWNETVYEITRVHNAYGRVVLGIDDDYEFYHAD